MRRLENIKKHIFLGKQYDTKYSLPNVDAEWLIEEVERLKGALEEIEQEADDHRREPWNRLKDMEQMAKDALKPYREE